MPTKQYQSWGKYPAAHNQEIKLAHWRDDLPAQLTGDKPVLAYGYGRSYGDSCLNEGGALIDMSGLRRLIAFDDQRGILRCDAGTTFAEILEVIVPRGWFLPVTPGTKYVSVGGAIANDVHGKNHHRAGTFGCHVTQFELLRSDGQRLVCSRSENKELFSATIGGLGLTGLISWAEFTLKPIKGPYIDQESIRFGNLDEFFKLSSESDKDFEYTVSWIDCLASGSHLGRGIFIRGNHSNEKAKRTLHAKPLIGIPVEPPINLLNKLSIWGFNLFYYRRKFRKVWHSTEFFDGFFYPLDIINEWNRLYGKSGLFQYQCVVPYEQSRGPIEEILTRIARSGQGSFLAVLKNFGDIPSPGMLSFPRPGITLSLDFANRGDKSLRLFDALDEIVCASGGAVYPAKDARMTAGSFQAYFPNWRDFARYVDPKFSSNFWRRVTPLQGQSQA